MAGTNVTFVALHTQQNNLWNCILPTPMSGIKPVRTYSNVNFVTNHTLQKIVWIIISMPSIGRNEMLSKSVVDFDRNSADLLFLNFYLNFSIPFLFWLLYSFSHILNGRHKCHFCGSSYATKNTLKAHTSTYHRPGSEKKFRHKCRFCDRSYLLNRSLMSHIKDDHWQEQNSM